VDRHQRCSSCHAQQRTDQRTAADAIDRCRAARFPGTAFTARILEDSRPADAPQRFRYSVTATWGHNLVHALSTRDYAYAQVAGLIVTGMATSGYQRMLDRLFGDTLGRTESAHRPS
jgi:hypothetical protein